MYSKKQALDIMRPYQLLDKADQLRRNTYLPQLLYKILRKGQGRTWIVKNCVFMSYNFLITQILLENSIKYQMDDSKQNITLLIDITVYEHDSSCI